MRAILINPFDKTISEIEISDDWREINRVLASVNPLYSGHFDVVRVTDSEGVYVDDEGMLAEGTPVFQWGDYPLAGAGLILACDESGESVSTAFDMTDVRANVTFPDLETTGDFGPSREYETEAGFVFEGGKPILRARAGA